MKPFKVGQKVWCVQFGWDEIESINDDDIYPILLKRSKHSFTLDGKFMTDQKRPILFHDEPKDWPCPDPPPPPLPDFKVDQPLLVRDCTSGSWKLRYFAKFDNGKVQCWGDGKTSKQISATTSWNEYKTLEQVLEESKETT